MVEQVVFPQCYLFLKLVSNGCAVGYGLHTCVVAVWSGACTGHGALKKRTGYVLNDVHHSWRTQQLQTIAAFIILLSLSNMDINAEQESKQKNKEVFLHKLTMVPFKEHKHIAPSNEKLFNIGVLKLNFGQV